MYINVLFQIMSRHITKIVPIKLENFLCTPGGFWGLRGMFVTKLPLRYFSTILTHIF